MIKFQHTPYMVSITYTFLTSVRINLGVCAIWWQINCMSYVKLLVLSPQGVQSFLYVKNGALT
jgi:hypothetical protein